MVLDRQQLAQGYSWYQCGFYLDLVLTALRLINSCRARNNAITYTPTHTRARRGLRQSGLRQPSQGRGVRTRKSEQDSQGRQKAAREVRTGEQVREVREVMEIAERGEVREPS